MFDENEIGYHKISVVDFEATSSIKKEKSSEVLFDILTFFDKLYGNYIWCEKNDSKINFSSLASH